MKSKPNIRNRYLVLVDIILVVASILGAFALRFELGPLFFYYLPFAYWMIGVSLVIKPLLFYAFGMYRRMWVYASIRELRLVASAVSTASILVTVVLLIFYSLKFFNGFVRSVLIIDWLLSILFFGGIRFLLRLIAENFKSNNLASPNLVNKRVLIIGAGDAGALGCT